jgi:hypothetical protein
MKNWFVTVALFILCLWMASRIVELEKFRYATEVGFCMKTEELSERNRCLRSKETRTHWVWHLAYGLKVL